MKSLFPDLETNDKERDMDNLVLDVDALLVVADVIGKYCTKQKGTLKDYYARIMTLESEWKDDETFGALAKEISMLKASVDTILDEMYQVYPSYFRDRARIIMSRPVFSNPGNGVGNSGNMGYPFPNTTGYSGGGNVGGGNVHSAPVGRTPNSFACTQQYWHQETRHTKIFNRPRETGQLLNCNQGVPRSAGGEGVEDFLGTCGLVSCENILRMAGVQITEEEIVTYARANNWCTKNNISTKNGGTSPWDRQAILSHYGIDSRVESFTDVEQIATYVAEGRGVIVSTEAYTLWNGDKPRFKAPTVPGRHAVTVTSVERDTVTDEIVAFYICDSGSKNSDSARRVSVKLFSRALQAVGGSINVTNTIIR